VSREGYVKNACAAIAVLFQVFNAVYAEFFREPFPARSYVQVAALPKGALFEIDAVAGRKRTNNKN
jgi:enamine deaminase RidA (YjgF/YER057c/UK114 family)